VFEKIVGETERRVLVPVTLAIDGIYKPVNVDSSIPPPTDNEYAVIAEAEE
jgi:hypothetical protein